MKLLKSSSIILVGIILVSKFIIVDDRFGVLKSQ